VQGTIHAVHDGQDEEEQQSEYHTAADHQPHAAVDGRYQP
jgi:hypothetical protein